MAYVVLCIVLSVKGYLIGMEASKDAEYSFREKQKHWNSLDL